MNDLLAKLDNGIRRISSLNALVEQVVEHIAPKTVAAAASCVGYIYSEPCQTGGYGSETCGDCGGATCYYRWEGTLYHYANGYKATGFTKKRYCSRTGPKVATCNSNCS